MHVSQSRQALRKREAEPCGVTPGLLIDERRRRCGNKWDQNGVFQNHSRLRTPPLAHSHSPNHLHHHHAASANSLNRATYTARSNPSPAPTDGSAPPDGPASGATEPGGGTADNWLLNSNIPLETRNISKQAFLETLQDNLIEMDVLASAQREAAYNHGHFLFKPGGTSPMYCTTSPGYPLTSSTVYSPPPRPLPRNTFSRPAFSLKKPSKHCNWKCAALSAILISFTLLVLLAYFIEQLLVKIPSEAMSSKAHHDGAGACALARSLGSARRRRRRRWCALCYAVRQCKVISVPPALPYRLTSSLTAANLKSFISQSPEPSGRKAQFGSLREPRILAMHLFGLNWDLQPSRQMYQLSEDNSSRLSFPTDLSLPPLGNTGLDVGGRRGKDDGKLDNSYMDDSIIDMGEIDVGRKVAQQIPPGFFWRAQVFVDHPMYLKFNVSLGKDALVGIYGRRGIPPTHTQRFDRAVCKEAQCFSSFHMFTVHVRHTIPTCNTINRF
ncbi:unnamed protein product [Boreogadus saida]